MRYVVAYDVSDDADRVRLHNTLTGYGVRIQRSVFECVLDDEQLAHMLARAGELLEPGVDRLHVFAQCETCISSRRTAEPDEDVMSAWFYVV